MHTTSKLCVAVSAALLSAPTLAAPQGPIQIYGIKHVGDSFVVEVPYHDLDLRQPSDVRRLSARVVRAASTVCAPRLYLPRLDMAQETACRDGAIDDAAPQMALARKRAEEFARNGYSAIPEVTVALRSAF